MIIKLISMAVRGRSTLKVMKLNFQHCLKSLVLLYEKGCLENDIIQNEIKVRIKIKRHEPPITVQASGLLPAPHKM